MNKINVTRSSMPLYEEYCEEIKDLWDSRWLTNMGEKHNSLQKELSVYLKVKNTSLFTNGHLALEATIRSLNLTGEVITTPFTFASTTQAIVRCGLRPIFCDINPVDYTIDTDKIEALITDKTSAIIPVHVYGNTCDDIKIESIAKKYNLRVIYDAAHAFGVEVKNEGIGTFGDASMFSFHATKVFNTIEGGCVTYNDERLTDILTMDKNFGLVPYGDNFYEIGGNAKMNEFQAAMGLCNLRHLDKEIKKRKAVVKRYQQNLKGIQDIKIWKEQDNVVHNYSYFPVTFWGRYSRDNILNNLAEHGIGARRYFWPITSKFECYKGKFEIQKTPVAEEISERVLTLPLFADLSLEDVDRICELVLL